MIDKNIVFILGAGASDPYGYPVGIRLRDDICLNFMSDMNKLFEKTKGDYYQLRDLIDGAAPNFIDRFQKSRVRSIDRWLSLNGKYKDIGKLAVVNAIVKCEDRTRLTFEGREKPSDWFSLLFNEMITGIGKPDHFALHKVWFITFNYDRVLEHLLYESFRNTFSEVGLEETNTILSNLRIIHVYGCVDEPPWKKGEYKYGGDYTLRYLDEARKRIMIVPEIVNNYPPKEIAEIDLVLQSAHKILFLGFGYDPLNLEILRIPQRFKAPSLCAAKILGTALGLFEEELDSIRLKLGPSIMRLETCDCTELLRKYFLGQG